MKIWTEEEVNFLKDNYYNLPYNDLISTLNRSLKSIQMKASKLKLKRNKNVIVKSNSWTNEETNILLSCTNMYIDDIVNLFPNRKREYILIKCNQFNIKYEPNKKQKHWTDEELNILMNNYQNKTVKDISKILISRNLQAIRRKCSELDLNINKIKLHYGEKSFFVCKMCHIEKDYNENFSKNSLVCKECCNKQTNINKYKNKYDITLDFNLMFNTYSPEEWYDFYYHKNMEMFPEKIINNFESICKIFKHVINNCLGLYSKSELLTISREMLKKYKIVYILYKYNLKLYELFNIIFPEYDIKAWELLCGVPCKFWDNKDNVDMYLKWFIKTKLQINTESELIENLKVFSVSGLRNIENHKLNNILFKTNFYESYYEWLSSAYPNIKFNKNDFIVPISFDGKKLDSIEELKIYEFIKKTFNLNICPTQRNSKYKFFNKLYNENYIPDFIINHNRNIKNIIIEYFGLWKENPKGEIYIKYHNKTIRKEEYFRNLPDTYFISFYPSDLNQNYRGINEKIINLLKII